MSTESPVSLRPVQILLDTAEYRSPLAWPFAAEPFYKGQVTRLLEIDIPKRASKNRCLVWTYHNPDGNAVGFGTLDVGKEYERFSEGKFHTYIPLLAVHPQFQKRGHGRRIVQHKLRKPPRLPRVRQIVLICFFSMFIPRTTGPFRCTKNADLSH